MNEYRCYFIIQKDDNLSKLPFQHNISDTVIAWEQIGRIPTKSMKNITVYLFFKRMINLKKILISFHQLDFNNSL